MRAPLVQNPATRPMICSLSAFGGHRLFTGEARTTSNAPDGLQPVQSSGLHVHARVGLHGAQADGEDAVAGENTGAREEAPVLPVGES